MVYNYKNILAFDNKQWIFSHMQLQLPGLKRTAPEQNSSVIAGLLKASALLFRIWKAKPMCKRKGELLPWKTRKEATTP